MPSTFKIYEPTRFPVYRIIRILELIFVCVCIGILIKLSPEDLTNPDYTIELFCVTVGSFLIILTVDVFTQVSGHPIPLAPMVIFLIIGASLFMTSGMVTIVEITDLEEPTIILWVFCITCITIALLMVIDILLFAYDCKKHSRVQMYRFFPMLASLAEGDIILHLVNPNPDFSQPKAIEKTATWSPGTKQLDQTNRVQQTIIKSRTELTPEYEFNITSEQKIMVRPITTDEDEIKRKDSIKMEVIKDPIRTEAAKLMDQPSEELIVKYVNTSNLYLTDSDEITSLKGKFYLVRQNKKPDKT